MAEHSNPSAVLGTDLVMQATFYRFTREQQFSKTLTLLTRTTVLPAAKKGEFLEETSVPINGYISLELRLSTIPRNPVLRIEQHELPVRRWDRQLGSVYNWLQRSVHHIPVVGKPVEGLLPDARQFNSLRFDVSVSVDRELTYCVELMDSASPSPVSSWKGTHQI